MTALEYDVFLSHNSDDKPFVHSVVQRLRGDGIAYWFDESDLVAGEFWQDEIERALAASDSCAVFFGPSGMGPWQTLEMRAALSQQIEAQREFRVIPVALPGTDPRKNVLQSILPAPVAGAWGVR